MLTFIVRRIAYSIPVLLLASLLVFVFVHATSDPLAKYAQSRDLTLKARQGLAQGIYEQPCRTFITGSPPQQAMTCTKAPVLKQYWYWLSHFLKGKMGNSFVTGRAVSSDLKSSFGNTLQLIIWGVLISALLAISIGVLSAVRQYSLPDYIFTGLSFVGLSMPTFWFGLIAIDLFSNRLSTLLHVHYPIFYSLGLHSTHARGFFPAFFDYARHLALPVATLTVQIVASWSRYERSSMLDVMSADYIRTATAKGLTRRRVIFRHGLRNALIPLVTVMALDIGGLFGGLVVTEQIFSIHGMGALFLQDLGNGDTQALLPWLMVTAVFVVLFNLLADVLYGVLDPRIRLS
ncbi:MAG: peptide/nickel transport system permease protein [Acidimicrobiaceae bacterium]|jgi:peptide/nickel transport system permease protein|nr:peptide/nickel transport system permease protein [Acidimicrobiaceae bacterium]